MLCKSAKSLEDMKLEDLVNIVKASKGEDFVDGFMAGVVAGYGCGLAYGRLQAAFWVINVIGIIGVLLVVFRIGGIL